MVREYWSALFSVQSGGEDKFTLTGGGSDGFIQVKGDLDYDNGKTNYALNVSVKVGLLILCIEE